MPKFARIAVLAGLSLSVSIWLVIPAEGAPNNCVKPHTAAFDVRGVVTGGSLSPDSGKKKTYSGTLMVTVTKTNKDSKAYMGPQTFTLSHVKASFEHGVNPAAPSGSLAHLQGNVTVAKKGCPTASGYTIKKAELKKPHPPKPHPHTT